MNTVSFGNWDAIGAFFGFTVADFDFDNRQVVIQRQFVRDEHETIYIAPKKRKQAIEQFGLLTLPSKAQKVLLPAGIQQT